RERVDRAGGPAPAVRAMAVAGADGITRHDEPDRTTEALPLECLLVLTHDTPRPVRTHPLPAHATARSNKHLADGVRGMTLGLVARAPGAAAMDRASVVVALPQAKTASRSQRRSLRRASGTPRNLAAAIG